jgi:hypothetical protein
LIGLENYLSRRFESMPRPVICQKKMLLIVAGGPAGRV